MALSSFVWFYIGLCSTRSREGESRQWSGEQEDVFYSKQEQWWLLLHTTSSMSWTTSCNQATRRENGISQAFFPPPKHLSQRIKEMRPMCNMKPQKFPIFGFEFISNDYSHTGSLIYYCFAHLFQAAWGLLWRYWICSPKPLLTLMGIMQVL